MQRARHAGIVTAGLLLLALPAAAEPHHLGEVWEAGIERGVEAQRRAVRRGTTPDNLVGRANRATRREASIAKLYLLARAYGVRAQWHRAQAGVVRGAAARRRHEASARDDHASALSTYREVIAKAPRCYFALHDMGVLTLQADADARHAAHAHFSNAYRVNARYAPTQRQLIQLYLAGKQYGVAVPLIQGLLDLDPKDDEARARLVSAYTALQRHAEARRELDTMLARRPGNLQLLALRAHLDLAAGATRAAIQTYKRLARANPNVPTAFMGILQALGKDAAAKRPTEPEDYLFALQGLRRIERDPKNLKRIEEDIRKIEHLMANPGGTQGPSGPPSKERLLHDLGGPDETARLRALLLLLTREEAPDRAVVAAVAGRLAPERESSAPVRVVAVRGLGRLTGSRLAPLLRHSLGDPVRAVRVEVVDALTSVAQRDRSVQGAVIAVLGLQAGALDTQVASAARAGILRLADVRLPAVGEDSDDGAWRRAFQTWWAGFHGTDVQIRALEQYHRFGDHTPADVLAPYLQTPEFHVFRAACDALRRSAGGVRDPARRAWYARQPRFAEARLKKEHWAQLKGEMEGWLAGRPGR